MLLLAGSKEESKGIPRVIGYQCLYVRTILFMLVWPGCWRCRGWCAAPIQRVLEEEAAARVFLVQPHISQEEGRSRRWAWIYDCLYGINACVLVPIGISFGCKIIHDISEEEASSKGATEYLVFSAVQFFACALMLAFCATSFLLNLLRIFRVKWVVRKF